MFANRSRWNEQSSWRTFHRCFLPSFSSFGRGVSEEKIKMWKVNGRQTTDAKWWQKLTLPLARWAKNHRWFLYVIMWRYIDITDIILSNPQSTYHRYQGFQYFSSVPALHYLQAVLFIKFEQFSWISYTTQSGGIKDHFRQGKVPGTPPYWKTCHYVLLEMDVSSHLTYPPSPSMWYCNERYIIPKPMNDGIYIYQASWNEPDDIMIFTSKWKTNHRRLIS
jgi:hypothetical protein